MKHTLATSAFCGPCKMVKEYIEKNNLDIEVKTMEDNIEFFQENNVKSVPTLLVEGVRYSGAEQIIKYFQISQ